MPSDFKIGQHKVVSFDGDFGHMALGSLGARTVQIGTGAFPRVSLSSFFSDVKNLFTRILNAVTPSRVRVESKVRRGIEDFSKKTGETLGSIFTGRDKRIDPQKLMQNLCSLRESAEPITKRGGSFEDLLKSRMRVNLSSAKLTDTQLRGLMEGLRSEEMSELITRLDKGPSREYEVLRQALNDLGMGEVPSPPYPQMLEDLSLIDSLIHDEALSRCGPKINQARREINETLMRSLQAVPELKEKPNGVYEIFATAMGKASYALDKMQETGLVHITDQNFRIFQNGMVKEGLSALKPEDRKAILQALPSSVLDELLSGVSPLHENVAPADESIRNEINERHTRNMDAFTKVAQQFLEAPKNPKEDPKALTQQVHELHTAIATLRKHCEKCHIEVPSSVGEKTAEIQKKLGEMLKPESLDPGGLQNTELHELGKALDFLGVGTLKETLTTEITKRKDKARSEYNEALESCLSAMSKQDHTALLSGVDKLLSVFSNTVETSRQLGETISGGDGITDFHAKLIGNHIGTMKQEDAKKLLEALRSKDLAPLPFALSDIGRVAQFKNEKLGERLIAGGMFLHLLTNELEIRMEKENVQLSEERRELEGSPTKHLSEEARKAVLSVYGMKVVGEEGKIEGPE